MKFSVVVKIDILDNVRLDILWNYRDLFIHGIWVTLGLRSSDIYVGLF